MVGRHRARALVFLAAALLLGQPVVAQPFERGNEYRQYFQDWLAACPNHIVEGSDAYWETSCFASTGSEELNAAGLPAYKLTLIRDRIVGHLDVAFTIAATDGSTLDTARPLEMRFSGRPVMTFDFETGLETRANTTNQYFPTDQLALDALIEQMRLRTAATLVVPVTGPGAPERTMRLSMQGAEAALEFMQANARRLAAYD